MKRLYTKDTKGKTRVWEAYSNFDLDENGYMTIFINHGVLDGKMQTKERKVKSGKNIGKANETSLLEQTKLEIERLYTAQYEDGYVDDINDYVQLYYPMLAHKYGDKKHTIDWSDKTYYSSPKLDGIRCFVQIHDDGSISFLSRTGKAFKYLEHIANEVKMLSFYNSLEFGGTKDIKCILDGELYNNDLAFNVISSLVNSKTYDAVEDVKIQFHIYDFIVMNSLELGFLKRFNFISQEINKVKGLKSLVLVEQIATNSQQQMMTLFSKYVLAEYEGLMLKADEPYVFGERSITLLKYKEMLDAEFKILDIFTAENDPLRVQITLQSHNENKDSFTVGTVKGNKETVYDTYYKNKDTLIGKWATVQYQTLSPYGIPLFPILLGIREGEEVDDVFVPSV